MKWFNEYKQNKWDDSNKVLSENYNRYYDGYL